jgi:hypothetical protein
LGQHRPNMPDLGESVAGHRCAGSRVAAVMHWVKVAAVCLIALVAVLGVSTLVCLGASALGLGLKSIALSGALTAVAVIVLLTGYTGKPPGE